MQSGTILSKSQQITYLYEELPPVVQVTLRAKEFCVVNRACGQRVIDVCEIRVVSDIDCSAGMYEIREQYVGVEALGSLHGRECRVGDVAVVLPDQALRV